MSARNSVTDTINAGATL